MSQGIPCQSLARDREKQGPRAKQASNPPGPPAYRTRVRTLAVVIACDKRADPGLGDAAGEASAARLDYSRSEEGAAKLLIGFGKLLSHCREIKSLYEDRRPGLSAAENISFLMKKNRGLQSGAWEELSQFTRSN